MSVLTDILSYGPFIFHFSEYPFLNCSFICFTVLLNSLRSLVTSSLKSLIICESSLKNSLCSISLLSIILHSISIFHMCHSVFPCSLCFYAEICKVSGTDIFPTFMSGLLSEQSSLKSWIFRTSQMGKNLQ